MRQALEIAIDYMNERLEDHDCKYQRHPATEAERINILADIETVKEALAQPEQSCPECVFGACHCKPLAQPEQEPVAIVDANDEGYWAEILPDRSVKVGQHLYAEAPQRTWVGLTDEELKKLCEEFWLYPRKLLQAIEAKLKEKNT